MAIKRFFKGFGIVSALFADLDQTVCVENFFCLKKTLLTLILRTMNDFYLRSFGVFLTSKCSFFVPFSKSRFM
jgi:hypothetical protein